MRCACQAIGAIKYLSHTAEYPKLFTIDTPWLISTAGGVFREYKDFPPAGVGVTKPIFSVPLFSHFFPNDQNSGYLYDIKFIFDRCHCSWAVETPGKYEHDWNYLTYTFAKSRFPVTEKLTKRGFSNPHPWSQLCYMPYRFKTVRVIREPEYIKVHYMCHSINSFS